MSYWRLSPRVTPATSPHSRYLHTANVRDIAALQSRLTTLGYQDGIDDGVEEAVQQGFDEGYEAGATAGWEVGTLYGGAAAAAAALVAFSGTTPRTGGHVGATVEGDGGHESGRAGEDHVSSAPLRDHEYVRSGSVEDGHLDEDRNTPSSVAAMRELNDLVDELRRASLSGSNVPPSRREDIAQELLRIEACCI